MTSIDERRLDFLEVDLVRLKIRVSELVQISVIQQMALERIGGVLKDMAETLFEENLNPEKTNLDLDVEEELKDFFSSESLRHV